MSTVLYPTGPLPPRVYWVRRLVVVGVPLILILIIAVSCSGGGGKKAPNSSNPGSGATTEPTTSTTAAADTACVPGDLSAQITDDATDAVYPVGASPTFTATITNVSASPCKLTSTAANETWTVLTGADKFWTTAGCPTQDTSTTKMLAPQATHRISITWDGKRLDPGCKPGAQAEAGTYRVRARLDGVKARQVIFYIHTNTQ